jgi:hypothetical protein
MQAPSAAGRNHSLTIRAQRGCTTELEVSAMLGMNTLRAITGGKPKEPVDQQPAEVGETPAETAEVHRIYPVANTAADPRLIELLKFVEELRADREDLRIDRDAWRGIALRERSRRWWWSRRASMRS